MADPKTCPCGCGKRVGWSPQKKGAASSYVELSSTLSFVAPILHDSLRMDDPPSDERQETERFLANGNQMRQWLIDHVHGTAAPGRTPDLLELAGGLRALNQDVARILAWADESGWIIDDGQGNPRYTGRASETNHQAAVTGTSTASGRTSLSPEVEASITFLGPCYQCRTSTPPRLSNAVVTTVLPESGVVTVCMLCDECLADERSSLWDGWMRKGSPPPKPKHGRLLVQTVGACFTCFAPMSTVSDLTGTAGKRMAPATCSSQCEIEARRQLG
jgi:hypothetical protein